MTTPKISVTINAYNSLPYLPMAVESILGQSLQDWHFYIVNDGSTDSTAEYLNTLKDPRIRIINQENSGTAVASNRVIKQCETPYLVRMDADDISLPHRLETLLAYMEARPEVGMAGSQAVWFGDKGKSKSLKLPTSHEAVRHALMSGFHAIVHPTVIMRTEVIRGIGGYWKYRQYDDDTDMMLRMGEAAKVVNIDEILYHYRIVANSLSGAGPRRVYFSYAYAIELAKLRENGLPEITPEAFIEQQAKRPWLTRFSEDCEMYGRIQYRKSVNEAFNQQAMLSRFRLGWAAMWAPRMTVQRLKRILGLLGTG